MAASKFTERIKELKMRHYLMIFVFAVLFFGTVIGIYNFRQRAIKEPVDLEIVSPVSEEGVYQAEEIVIEGQTEEGVSVVVGETETESDGEGRFYAEVPLEVGENIIEVRAGSGREENTASVVVLREEITPTPPVVYDEVAPVEIAPEEPLSNSGPGTFWLGEALVFSGSSLAYLSARRRYKRAWGRK